jgi:hypothetical protein
VECVALTELLLILSLHIIDSSTTKTRVETHCIQRTHKRHSERPYWRRGYHKTQANPSALPIASIQLHLSQGPALESSPHFNITIAGSHRATIQQHVVSIGGASPNAANAEWEQRNDIISGVSNVGLSSLATNPLTELSLPFSLDFSKCFKPHRRFYRWMIEKERWVIGDVERLSGLGSLGELCRSMAFWRSAVESVASSALYLWLHRSSAPPFVDNVKNSIIFVV